MYDRVRDTYLQYDVYYLQYDNFPKGISVVSQLIVCEHIEDEDRWTKIK